MQPDIPETFPHFSDAIPVQFGDESIEDTERWGIKTYRVHALSKRDLRLYEDGFVIARIDCDRIDLVQAALRMGYQLCDTLTYWMGSVETPNLPLPPGYWMRPVMRGDVYALALQAFDGYQSHYSADKRLDQKQIPNAYAEWASSFKEGVVIEHEKCEFPYVHRKVVAFGLFSDPCELTLAAVDREHGGQGLYKHLVMACMRYGKTKEQKEIEISTQVTNIAVQKAWAKLGLRPHRYAYTLHWWP